MRKQKFVEGHFYHIFNRGVNREPIFFSRTNRLFFLTRLRDYFLVDETASIIAYCLMRNHYHLLVQTHVVNFGIRVMQPFGVSYTKAINKEQGRVGSLFQGPFKAVPVEDNAHLLGLSRYIHLNPVEAGLVDHPSKWEFSSYRDFVGLRDGKLPQARIILEQFESPDHYAAYVTDEDHPESGFPSDLLFD